MGQEFEYLLMLVSKANLMTSLQKLYENKLSDPKWFLFKDDLIFLIHAVLLIAELPISILDRIGYKPGPNTRGYSILELSEGKLRGGNAPRDAFPGQREQWRLDAHKLCSEGLREHVCDLAMTWATYEDDADFNPFG